MSTIPQNPISTILDRTGKTITKNKGCIVHSTIITALLIALTLILYIIVEKDPAKHEDDKTMDHLHEKTNNNTTPMSGKTKTYKPNQSLTRKKMLRKCFSECISDFVTITEEVDNEVNKVVILEK